MKKKFPVFKTASLAAIAGLGVYAISNQNALGQISSHGASSLSANSLTLSADSARNATNPYLQQIKQLQQEIEQQLQNIIQQVRQSVGLSLVSQRTPSTTQLQNQLQSQWQQEQTQLQNQWQQAQSQLQNQLPQQLPSQWQEGWQQQGGQSALPSPSQGLASGQVVSLPTSTQPSGNWAGYIDTPTLGGYTSVSGSWTIPKISGNQNSVAAQWIGLGGVTNQDLLQMGTLEQFDNNGQPVAQVFWETLPKAAQPVMTVPVGSTINAKISQASKTTWDITFSARTLAGKTISKTIPVSINSSYSTGIGTSAEWISEDPSDTNNNLYPLANMGTVHYSNATVDGQAFDTNSNQVVPVALVDNYGNLLMAPSTVGTNGSSFSTDTFSTGVGAGGQFVGGAGGQTLIPGSRYSWGGGRHHLHGQGWDGYTAYGYGYVVEGNSVR